MGSVCKYSKLNNFLLIEYELFIFKLELNIELFLMIQIIRIIMNNTNNLV